jgi:arginase
LCFWTVLHLAFSIADSYIDQRECRHAVCPAGERAMLYGLKTISRTQRIAVIEVATGAGARDSGCRDGPAGFRQNAESRLREQGVRPTWHRMPGHLCSIDLPPLQVVSCTACWTAGITRRLTADGERFLVVGGDHSCAIGTWSGVSDALRPAGALGLVWIDAHMDMHVPETTHSGAINGMPVACLLGHGAPELTSVAQDGPAIDPRHVCLVGARSFEPEEIEFAKRHGVRVIGMPEVRRRGIEAVLAEAKAIATHGTAGYGVSLDLDAFDPTEAPGVGTPVPGGLRAADFLAPWAELTRDSTCVGIEIVEYNPSRDQSGRTARLMQELVLAWV